MNCSLDFLAKAVLRQPPHNRLFLSASRVRFTGAIAGRCKILDGSQEPAQLPADFTVPRLYRQQVLPHPALNKDVHCTYV